MKSKEQFEELINNSPFFELSEGDFYYNSELSKLRNDVFEYCINYTWKEAWEIDFKFNGAMSDVLWDTICNCISTYKKSYGEFIHYFNSALKQNYNRKKAEEKFVVSKGGICISKKAYIAVKNTIEYAKCHELDINNDSDKEQLAILLNMSIDSLNKQIDIYNLNHISFNQTNSEGNEYLSEMIPDLNVSRDEEEMIAENVARFMKAAEQVFNILQDRQKPIISFLFTMEVFLKLLDVDKGEDKNHLKDRAREINENLMKYSFYNSNVFKCYNSYDRLPKQREFANVVGRDEASISRAYKVFKGKVATQYNNLNC